MRINLYKAKYNLFISAVLITSLSINTVLGQINESFKMKTVILDAGHGGHDSGTVWGKHKEKDIVLSVVLKLGKMIKDQYPDIKVVYTRDKDVFIPLFQRGKIANNAKGDLFISVHVNAAPSTAAKGVETFTLGMHKSAANLEVAKKENSVIVLEDDYKQSYEGFDPNDDESYIIFGLGQHAYGRKSISFSSELQNQYGLHLKTSDRGMKQAGFLVLWATSMPCVLTEIGFLSNASDRAYLTSDSGVNSISQALFKAFSRYKNGVEVVTTFDVKEPVKDDANTSKKVSKEVSEDLYYTVQVTTSSKKIATNSAYFKEFVSSVSEYKEGGLYKYCIGKENSYKEIVSLQNKLIKKGFKGCFVIAFENGKKITLEEAKQKLK